MWSSRNFPQHHQQQEAFLSCRGLYRLMSGVHVKKSECMIRRKLWMWHFRCQDGFRFRGRYLGGKLVEGVVF